MARLPGEVDGRRFLRAIARLGWTVESQRGSHRKLIHPGSDRFIVVAFHRVIRRNSIRHVLRLAGIAEEEFIQVL